MKKVQLNLKYKQKGMTLVEVLIAGIILFISISVISMVARTKILNEQKLVKTINTSYLAEYSQTTIKYHLKHTEERQGSILIAGTEYLWNSQLKETKPFVFGLNPDDNNAGNPLKLYAVVFTRVGSQKIVLEFLQLV